MITLYENVMISILQRMTSKNLLFTCTLQLRSNKKNKQLLLLITRRMNKISKMSNFQKGSPCMLLMNGKNVTVLVYSQFKRNDLFSGLMVFQRLTLLRKIFENQKNVKTFKCTILLVTQRRIKISKQPLVIFTSIKISLYQH